MLLPRRAGNMIQRKKGSSHVKSEKKKTTSQRLLQIRRSGTFREMLDTHDPTEEPSLCQYLYQLMEEKHLSAREMITDTGVHKSYFYAVLAGQKTPGKNIILRFSLALHCTLNETNRLLRLAGLSDLYPLLRRDAVLIYAVEQKSGVQKANELLEEAGEELLYR